MIPRRIGVFGGSFDPPHEGHCYLARCAVEALSLDRLLIFPAGQPPHKPLLPGHPTPEARLAMARLAFADIPRCEVSDREILRPGKSYTVLTLRELARKMPDAELFLVMGSDMFLSVQSWFCASELFGLCTLAPAMRYGTDSESALRAHSELLASRYGARCTLLQIPPRELSSTELRAEHPWADARFPAAVRAYIRENRLYEACL